MSRVPARLLLPGSGSADATIEVIPQRRAKRITMALVSLSAAVAVMPLVFLVPPHLLWPLLSLVVGLYVARRFWIGEYYVVSFTGSCPRCGTALELARGTRIRARQSLECYSCHRQPELVLDGPDG